MNNLNAKFDLFLREWVLTMNISMSPVFWDKTVLIDYEQLMGSW